MAYIVNWLILDASFDADGASTCKEPAVEMSAHLKLRTCDPKSSHRATEHGSQVGALLPCIVLPQTIVSGVKVLAHDPFASKVATDNSVLLIPDEQARNVLADAVSVI